MKLEIEVAEADIKSAIESKIRAAIADKVNCYMMSERIKDAVQNIINEAIGRWLRSPLPTSCEILPALSLHPAAFRGARHKHLLPLRREMSD